MFSRLYPIAIAVFLSLFLISSTNAATPDSTKSVKTYYPIQRAVRFQTNDVDVKINNFLADNPIYKKVVLIARYGGEVNSSEHETLIVIFSK